MFTVSFLAGWHGIDLASNLWETLRLPQTLTLQTQSSDPLLQSRRWRSLEFSSRQLPLDSELSCFELVGPANAMQRLLICWRAPFSATARKSCRSLQVAVYIQRGKQAWIQSLWLLGCILRRTMSVSYVGFAIMLSSLYTARRGQDFYPAVGDF